VVRVIVASYWFDVTVEVLAETDVLYVPNWNLKGSTPLFLHILVIKY
jgi:hypothetical protein